MSPKFQSVLLFGQPFWLTGHFETSASDDPKRNLNTTTPQRYSIYVLQMLMSPKFKSVPQIYVCYGLPESQLSVSFPLRPPVSELHAILRQVYRITPKWPWTLHGQRYPIYVLEIYRCLKFHPIFLCDQPFLRYKIVDNWKCTKLPQNGLEPLTVKSTLYPLNAIYRGPNFCLCHSTASHFQDTMLLKIGKFGNVPNDLRLTWKS